MENLLARVSSEKYIATEDVPCWSQLYHCQFVRLFVLWEKLMSHRYRSFHYQPRPPRSSLARTQPSPSWQSPTPPTLKSTTTESHLDRWWCWKGGQWWGVARPGEERSRAGEGENCCGDSFQWWFRWGLICGGIRWLFMVDSKNVVSWLWRWRRGLEFLDGQKRARKERNSQDILNEELCRGITVKNETKSELLIVLT